MSKSGYRPFYRNPIVHTQSGKYDYCPYCKATMRMVFDNEREYGYDRSSRYPKIVFKCDCCGARSPFLYASPALLDIEKVTKEMDELIEDYVAEYSGDEECGEETEDDADE